jgi:gas vesicle protein
MNNRIYYSQEAEQLAIQQRRLALVVFSAFGLGIGAALALLFAPKKGEETRRVLSNAVSDGVESGREFTQEAINKMEKEIVELRKRLDERIN